MNGITISGTALRMMDYLSSHLAGVQNWEESLVDYLTMQTELLDPSSEIFVRSDDRNQASALLLRHVASNTSYYVVFDLSHGGITLVDIAAIQK